MNPTDSTPGALSPAAPAAAPAPSIAQREARLTAGLLLAALGGGVVLQAFIPPGGVTLVAGAVLAGAAALGLALVAPGRLRETLAGFRFIATLLFVLSLLAVLGTLVLQLKPPAFYLERYGFAGKLILALRLDDVFHGLPLALLMALFGASVLSSATLRWPPRARNFGFFLCHLGLLTSLAGAAASATLAVRGRIDLYSGGETATQVQVTRANQPGAAVVPLGFELRLDRFELVSYETEYRVGYYEQRMVVDESGKPAADWTLRASFDVDGERHRLPGGDSFRLRRVYPDFRAVKDPAGGEVSYVTATSEWKNPVAHVELRAGGAASETLLSAVQGAPAFLSPERALVFERRQDGAKQYVSHVSAMEGGRRVERTIAVNAPLAVNGWTLYQMDYRPSDPSYSGLEAVYDPGVAWVFAGFALICAGVFAMFWIEPRLRKGAAAAAR